MTNADALNRTLFIADNIDVLRGIDSDSIDLIATDPPYNKKVKAFTGTVKAGESKGKEVSYKDVWTWDNDVQQAWADRIREDHPNLYGAVMAANATHSEGMGAFLCWLGVRVLEMHRILKPTGSLYLQCDDTAAAYVKMLLDAVFGSGGDDRKGPGFKAAILWKRTTSNNAVRKNYGRILDTVFFYTKSRQYTWNQPLQARSDVELKRYVAAPDGRLYKCNDLTAPSPQPERMFSWRGQTPPNGWRYSLEYLEQLDAEGRIAYRRDGIVRLDGHIQYLDEQRDGQKAQNLWADVPPVKGNEDTGYPTQKPLALYERIIKASSNEGDIVLDPFAGCATTCVAAESLGRRWIGIDINEEAGEVLRSRLQLAQGTGYEPVQFLTDPPPRTDDGAAAAPELVLVAATRRERGLSLRQAKERLLADVGMRCQGCGFIPPHDEYLEVDHKRPKKEGGRDEYRNLTLLCRPCNGKKGAKLTLRELHDRLNEEERMLDPEWYQREGRWA